MATTEKKQLKDNKFGLTGSKKKLGINYWRFVFNAIEDNSGAEQMFYIEFEMINPWLSPDEVVLGFKPRVKISADDLQYALAGTQSAKSFDTETQVQPSYCAIRVGMFGNSSKQLCYYFPIKQVKFNNKPFEIIIDNKTFTEDTISGFLSVSEEDINAHPEYLCNSGYAKWDITYSPVKTTIDGYNNNNLRWFPAGLNTRFAGKINFDGNDYSIDSRRSSGYMERLWGKDLPETWFHVSSSTLTSAISGKTLFDSSFSIKGIFEDKVSFLGSFGDLEIQFIANSSKFNTVWDCSQMPQSEDESQNLLHWSVSLDNKNWVVDVDVFCKIKEMFNRNLELPVGFRKVMNMLQGGTGTGELKLYKKIGNTLEQIEHAQLAKVICEFGHTEEGEF